MKNKVTFLAVGCLVGLMSSCLGGTSDNYDVEIPKNCQISSFSLSHDSITVLKTAKFTIDQLNGRIFNADSLPYGTEVGKVLCALEFMDSYSVGTTQMMPEATGDTIVWSAKDSADFSKPVRFVVNGFEGVSKTYIAQVNIHQVNPDSMAWALHAGQVAGLVVKEQATVVHKYNGVESYFMYVQTAEAGSPYRLYRSAVGDDQHWSPLPALSGLPSSRLRLKQLTAYEGSLYLPSESGTVYRSADGLAWEAISTDKYAVHYIIGAVKAGSRQASALAAIVRPVVSSTNELQFASMNKEGIWQAGEEVPDDFPLTGFGSAGYSAMYYEYLMIAGGRDHKGQLLNSSWSTSDGRTWALLTDRQSNYFSKREGVLLTAYDDKLWLIGGIDGQGVASKEIYHSLDKGVSWILADAPVALPEAYLARGFASVLVDKDRYLLIFGGRKSGTDTNEADEVWRGRVNRLGF